MLVVVVLVCQVAGQGALVDVVLVHPVDVVVMQVVDVVVVREGQVAASLAVGVLVVGVRAVLGHGGHRQTPRSLVGVALEADAAAGRQLQTCRGKRRPPTH
jgi:hypothetical protein